MREMELILMILRSISYCALLSCFRSLFYKLLDKIKTEISAAGIRWNYNLDHFDVLLLMFF